MNKNKNKYAPKLDLSFAYGTGIMKQLTAQDIKSFEAEQEAESNAEQEVESGAETIRTITSFYTGCRPIRGLTDNSSAKDTAKDSSDSDG